MEHFFTINKLKIFEQPFIQYLENVKTKGYTIYANLFSHTEHDHSGGVIVLSAAYAWYKNVLCSYSQLKADIGMFAGWLCVSSAISTKQRV